MIKPLRFVVTPSKDLDMVFIECPQCYLLSHVPQKELEQDILKCRHCSGQFYWEDFTNV